MDSSAAEPAEPAAFDEGAPTPASVEELALLESALEETVADEVALEEIALEVAVAEEVAAEEIALEEAVAEAVAIEELALEDAVTEEVAREEAILEDAAAEAVAAGDISLEDAIVAVAVIEEELEEAAVDAVALEEAALEASAAEGVAVVEAALEESAAEEVAIAEALIEDAAVADVALVEAALEDAADEQLHAEAVAEAPRPAADATTTWGRVDDDGTVYVREGESWREVGQFPDGSAEEALAYFERKYADLAGEVGLLEVRARRGGASASELRSSAKAVRAKVAGAAAVGDLAALDARLVALTATLAAESATEAAAAREAVDDALRARTELVEKAEALAARDPKSVQWREASVEITALFDQWQTQQQNGPRLPKAASQQLWKRFRDARSTLDRHRREFYAGLDETHKAARDQKTRLIEKAEALAPKGEEGITAYRALLDQWKTIGRAGKKSDDALWARFKAAGDALYSARAERDAAETEASREKIETRRALLVEAKTVAEESDLAKARSKLTAVQRRWDEVGRIFPREQERALDDELRKIEQALRAREDQDWKRNNPETKARAGAMSQALLDAIEKLEAELAAAKKAGDKAAIAKATEALAARKSWLTALGG